MAESGIEPDLVGRQSCGAVDHAEMEIAFLLLAHGVGKLVLVKVDDRG